MKRQITKLEVSLGAVAVLAFGALMGRADSVWDYTKSGNWSAAANWAAGGVPVSGAATVLEFGGASGGAAYSANNDIASPFVLYRINLTGNPDAVSQITGGNLSFAAPGGGIQQLGSGAFAIANALDLAVDTLIGGGGAGSVTLAGALSGSGRLRKEGPGTLVWNSLGGSPNSFTVAGGTLAVDTGTPAAYTMSGSAGSARTALLDGASALWTINGYLTIGANAAVVVTNGATLDVGADQYAIVLDTKGGGSVPSALCISGGSKVNVKAKGGSPARWGMLIGNGTSGDAVIVRDAGTVLDVSPTTSSGLVVLRVGSGSTAARNNLLLVTDGASLTGKVSLEAYGYYNSLIMSNGACGPYSTTAIRGTGCRGVFSGTNTVLDVGRTRFTVGAQGGVSNFCLIDGATVTGINYLDGFTIGSQGEYSRHNGCLARGGATVDLGSRNLLVGSTVGQSPTQLRGFCSNNWLRVTGSNTLVKSTTGLCDVGGAHVGGRGCSNGFNTVTIDSGATMSLYRFTLGLNSHTDYNSGVGATGNGLIVTNGGNLELTTGGVAIGPALDGLSNYVVVAGAASVLQTTGPIEVGLGAGSRDNRFILAGGQVSAASLTVAGENMLAPVLGKDGILAMEISGNATFDDGSLISPAAAPDAPAGTYTVLTAATLTDNGLELDPAVNPAMWSFNADTANGKVTVSYKPAGAVGTLLLVR